MSDKLISISQQKSIIPSHPGNYVQKDTCYFSPNLQIIYRYSIAFLIDTFINTVAYLSLMAPGYKLTNNAFFFDDVVSF